MDDRVSHISSIFYSALQALCFMFPIAPPEINQSNTCSRPLGWWRPSTSLPVPRITAVRSLSKVNALTWRLRHPSSKPYLKKVERSHENQHLLFLFLLLLLLFPCLAPSCACVSANTGAWIVDKPPVQLSSAQRSLGNGLTLCNKKTFFFFNSPLHFFLKCLWENIQVRLELLYRRNNWTQTDLQGKKRVNYFIYFNI